MIADYVPDTETVVPRRRRSALDVAEALVPDRLPPHSIEAEQGVLGCCLLDNGLVLPDALDAIHDPMTAFYDLKHVEVFRALSTLHRSGSAVDIITLQQHLKDSKLLDMVGGIAYLMSLADAVPSSANLKYYLDIVLEKALLRRVIRVASQAVADAYEMEGDPGGLLEKFDASVKALALDADRGAGIGVEYSTQALRDFVVRDDPNRLLGDRWLCKGGAIVIAGPSGIGKSTLLMGWAAHWAIGRPVYGIEPVRPLVQWVLQAENDAGDLAEMLQGVEWQLWEGDEFRRFEEESLLDANLVFKSIRTACGASFIRRLTREILTAKQRPDVIWLDPLVAFTDRDLSKQDGAAEFLRRGLGGITEATGVAWMINHHTTKTSTDPKAKTGWKLNDYQYATAGSYDVVGWARGSVVLQPVDDHTCRALFPKRGGKAGLRHPDGTPTLEVWLKHAEQGRQAWVQVDPPAIDEDEADNAPPRRKSAAEKFTTVNLTEVYAAMSPTGEPARKMARLLKQRGEKEGVYASDDRIRKTVLEVLVETGKLAYDEVAKLYTPGPNK
jgi:hypothetical protein